MGSPWSLWLRTVYAPSYLAWATSELAMPASAAGRSSLVNAPEPPPGVTLPADYIPKRCRRCGILGGLQQVMFILDRCVSCCMILTLTQQELHYQTSFFACILTISWCCQGNHNSSLLLPPLQAAGDLCDLDLYCMTVCILYTLKFLHLNWNLNLNSRL